MCNWYCKVEPTFHFLHYFSTLIIEFFFPELSNLLSKIVRKQWDDSDEYSFLGDTSLEPPILNVNEIATIDYIPS